MNRSMQIVGLASLGFFPALCFHVLASGSASRSDMGMLEDLGRSLFFDPGLSNPPGRSCSSCHAPERGFSDPSVLPVSRAAEAQRFGFRNTPTLSYAAFIPPFHFDEENETYVGGLFWDGRADSLAEQAKGPLLSHLEMNNMGEEAVVDRVAEASYRGEFERVFGKGIWVDHRQAFDAVVSALVAYQNSYPFSPFSSKFDAYTRGEAELSDSERRGVELYNDPEKGNCAACHPSALDSRYGKILFTDFTYDNLGVPANPELDNLCPDYETDYGLGARLAESSGKGKFRVPTLRNVAKTAPYFHNGSVATLREAVLFYRDRDKGDFGPPEVMENMNTEELGALDLSDDEVDDIVAFLETLTDGYDSKNGYEY